MKQRIFYSTIIIFVGSLVGVGTHAYYQSDIYEATKPIRCIEMSSIDIVEEDFKKHQSIVSQIQELGGTVSVVNPLNNFGGCEGAGYVVIYYGTETQRKQIKQLIGKTFFGHPYKMFNI